MTGHKHPVAIEKLISILFVFVLHWVALWAAWQPLLAPDSSQVATIFVRFIAPPSPNKEEVPKKPLLDITQQVTPRVAKPVIQISEVNPNTIADQPQASESIPSEQSAETPDMPLPDGPVTLSSELAVVCANRTAPSYPPLSRQMREEGTVVLRVELAENGQVDKADIRQSSGFSRLDDAALSAVKNWRCDPPIDAGKHLRAVALQPFNFQLKR